MKCPKCESEMQHSTEGGFYILVCKNCDYHEHTGIKNVECVGFEFKKCGHSEKLKDGEKR